MVGLHPVDGRCRRLGGALVCITTLLVARRVDGSDAAVGRDGVGAGVCLALGALRLFGALGWPVLLGLGCRSRLPAALFRIVGLGLLVVRLGLRKSVVAGLEADPRVGAVLVVAGGSFSLAFLLGVLSGGFLQSAQVATVLLLLLLPAVLVGLQPVAAVFYGASLGTGFGRLLVAGSMDLAPRRLTFAGASASSSASLAMRRFPHREAAIVRLRRPCGRCARYSGRPFLWPRKP